MDTWELKEKADFSTAESPVVFTSKGKRLFGILHSAVNNGSNAGVIFLNSGLQYRTGPHRIYVKAAREFSLRGISSLRMDFSGIGDSQGEIRDPHFDCFDVEDTMRAVDFLLRNEMVEKVVLLGLCAGARNAVKTAVRDARIDSVVLWSLPFYAPLNSATGRHFSRSLSRKDIRHQLQQWMEKSLNIQQWRKYLSSHGAGELIPVITNAFRRLLFGGSESAEACQYHEFSDVFKSFSSSGRKVLFIYGENDPIIKDFEERFRELSGIKNPFWEYQIIPKGDHTFTSLEAEKTVIEKTAEWLALQYESEISKNQRSVTCLL